MRPQIYGKVLNNGTLAAAFPALFRIVFPSTLHKKIFGFYFNRLGDIGQPEGLFPVADVVLKINLSFLSPFTSPVIAPRLRSLNSKSLRTVGISKHSRHRNPKRLRNAFFREKGKIIFTSEIDRYDYSNLMMKIYSDERSLDRRKASYIKNQIQHLYDITLGCILMKDDEPVAGVFTLACESSKLYCVEGILLANQKEKISYGGIALLSVKEKALEIAQKAKKELRYSYGFIYNPNDYKKLWTEPEKTTIAY